MKEALWKGLGVLVVVGLLATLTANAPVRQDALAGYTFEVEIDGIAAMTFQEVSGLSIEIEVLEIQEGGSSEPIRKFPGTVRYGDLTLKRGVTSSMELWTWIKQVQDGDIGGARRDGKIVLYDRQENPVARWEFVSGWPSKVSLGPLASSGNDILIEEATIVHEGLSRVQ